MKKFKKIISFCLLFTLAIPTISANASSIEKNTLKGQAVEKKAVNEYTNLKELQKKSTNQLKVENYSDSQIDQLKSMDVKKEYGKYIKQMSNYSKEQLKQFNYTDNQINAIKNYDGSELMTAAAASSVTVYTSESSYSYSSSADKTTAVVDYSFQWDGIPFFKFTDAMAFCWSEDMYINKSSSTCKVYFKYYANGSSTGTLTSQNCSIKPEGAGTGAARVNFATLIDFNTNCVIYKGSGKISLYKLGKVSMFALRASYMHKTLTTGAASFSFPGGVSIDVDTNTTEEDYSLQEYTL